ncbi:TonB-dependent siderophore receptor [Acinetobacter kanungonis]|uniref:TonB-dependent siderophore receptor n=1 Tax=Acinetobacter kanungonis TaxID=2699469 RepID=UPI00137A52F3|nr:TonB-dependent siderophore receptor [Acinetobacter kanungonis]NCI79796.1 TonB-dependent siderophore receptor [Acinetobacter kanungonis]
MYKFSVSAPKPLYLAMQIIFLSSSAISFAHAETSEEEATNAPVSQLETITLKAEDKTAVTENTGSYTTGSTNTATKLNLSLRETPQTVKVYTREYLDDRNIESFQDLMNNITGVSTPRTDERQRPYARGFDVDYFLIDGKPTTANLVAGDLDLSLYDRVEVVKGANGLMTGAGNPAMGINLIRKHANAKEFTGSVNASAGSWNSYASSADLSAPLNNDGSLRGRVFVKHSDEDSFMDFYEKERNIVYGAIDYDLSDKTLLSFAASYQELNRDGVRWGGLPAFYTDGSRTNFDRSLTVSSDWTYWDAKTTMLFADLKHYLYNDVSLNVSYFYRREDSASNLLYTTGKVDKATNTLAVIPNVSVYTDDQRTDENNIDAYISVPFTLVGREQEIIFGGSWNKSELKKNDFGGSYYTGQNVLNVDALDFNNIATEIVVPVERNQKGALNNTVQTAGYISGKFHILDPLKAVVGVRVSNWKYEVPTNSKANREFENEITPYFGLIYDLSRDYSAYASYTSIFKPQSRKDVSGNYLDPIDGKSYEIGLKGEYFDGKLNAALSIFRIEQDNVAAQLFDSQGNAVKVKDLNGVNTTENAYYAAEGVTSKGVELNVDGEINENWGLSFGVANFDAKDAKGDDYNPTSSRTTADLFVKYKNEAWYAGAGLNYFSKIYRGTGATRIDRGDLYLANAMLGYKFDQNFSAQVNVNNLFDKKYYEGIATDGMIWGEPRNATLSLNYRF